MQRVIIEVFVHFVVSARQAYDEYIVDILAELSTEYDFSYLVCVPRVGFADLVVEG